MILTIILIFSAVSITYVTGSLLLHKRKLQKRLNEIKQEAEEQRKHYLKVTKTIEKYEAYERKTRRVAVRKRTDDACGVCHK